MIYKYNSLKPRLTIFPLIAVLFVSISLPNRKATAASNMVTDQMILLMGGDETHKPGGNVAKDDKGGSCGPEPLMPVETCEAGQGALCLNTPPGSVAGKYVIVKGTLDKKADVFSHIRVYVQHDYTKALQEVVIRRISVTACWDEEWVADYDACIDEDGFFGVRVPLSQLGPYTITIDAVALAGGAVSKSVRTSRVIAPVISKEDISIDPSPAATGGRVNARKVNVEVDLLHDCKFCDFIGMSTGGLTITVTNRVISSGGGMKKVERRGNMAQAGKISICVPVLEGVNELTVTACNAATGSSCPEVSGISFTAGDGAARIRFISPTSSGTIFDSSVASQIPLKFSIDGGNYECGDVSITWNRSAPVSICPDEGGLYHVNLTPDIGMNIGVIEVKDGAAAISDSFVVGWGRLINPYLTDDAGWLKGALGLHIGADFLNETLRPVFNDFLISGNLKYLVSALLSGKKEGGGKDKDEEDSLREAKISEIRSEIPFCRAGGSLLSGVIEVVGEPSLKWGELERFEFDESGIRFKLDLEGLELRLKYVRDENKDGRPDTAPLPLLISFKAAQIDGRIRFMPDGKPLFLISSDNTDCNYQSKSYCVQKPALLVPANFLGGATKGGAFVRCDDKGQQMDGETREKCTALNILNAQTGFVSQEILNLINDKLYCGGSAAITYLLREKMRDVSAGIGFLAGKTMHIGGGIDIGSSNVKVDKKGVLSLITSRFGGMAAGRNIDEKAIMPGVGVLAHPISAPPAYSGGSSSAVSLSISTTLINELLYQMTFQKDGMGLLDWDIDYIFSKGLGFDFTQECDAFQASADVQAPPAVCQLRPRVSELLGTALVTNGYFSGKHPLKVVTRGSRAVPPHIKIYRTDVPYELPPQPGEEDVKYEYRPADVFELQIPNLEIAFYALEVDEGKGKDVYGNPYLLLDGDGKAIIHSMLDGSEAPAPIIRAGLTLLVPLEIQGLATSAKDPSKFVLKVRIIPSFARVLFHKIEGGNATIVPDDSLLASFREKLNYIMEIYGNENKPVEIEMPKSFSLIDFEHDILSYLGLEEVFFGSDGLSLSFDPAGDRINISIKPRLE